MSKPIVAVVGRPNVGKSTLFNSLCGQQISIVKDTPGVTRDRIYAEVSWLNHNFTLIDTGGIEPDTGDIILSQMREQAEIAIETADIIIFMTDVKQGLVDSDSKVADMLRRSHKPVILVVNKVDSFEKMMPDVYEFYNLGIGEPFPISAVNKLGFGEVLDEVVSHFPEGSDTDEEDDRPKVAIIGKPNVGKSSIINKLVGKNRVIVSDIAGTTRDIIQESMKLGGISLNLIDTAGIHETNDVVEKIGVGKAKECIEKADLVVYVVDASVPLDESDQSIIEMLSGKKVIVLLNKSDMKTVVYEQLMRDNIVDIIGNDMDQCRIISTSTKEKTGLREFEEQIRDMFFTGEISFNDEILITNVRQERALVDAKESLCLVKQSLKDEMPEDFYSIDLMNAYASLGSIIGEEVEDDLVQEIFSKFCMGK